MTDKNYKDALAERLTQVNVAATELFGGGSQNG